MINKAQVHVFAAIEHIRAQLPFTLAGIDSDNGSEFINAHLARYCEAERITFTRARAYRKNDNCYVEQKNWSVVRRAVGYARYDTEGELALLNDLYELLRLHNNFFVPSMKLVSKTRTGAKVTKIHGPAKTPYRRLIESEHIDEATKETLRATYKDLNPLDLKRRISKLQDRLIKSIKLKEEHRRKEVQAQQFEYISDEATNRAFEYILT